MIGLPLEKLSYSWGQKWVQKTTCIFEPYEGPPLLTLLYNLSVHDLLYTYTLVYIYIYIYYRYITNRALVLTHRTRS